MQFIPNLIDLKNQENIQKPTAKFIQQRRKLYSQYCPEIHMEFAFKNKQDGSIRQISSLSAPLKELQNNREYIKLFEISHIEVNALFFLHIFIYRTSTLVPTNILINSFTTLFFF